MAYADDDGTTWDLYRFAKQKGLAEGVTQETIAEIERLLNAGSTVIKLVEQKSIELPSAILLEVAEAYGSFIAWKKATSSMWGEVPAQLLQAAVEPHQIDLLERARRLAPREVWSLGLTLWNRCFALACDEGQVRVDGEPGNGFDEYLHTSEALSDIAPHRWLRIRRGEREHALSLHFVLPQDTFVEQCGLFDFDLTLFSRLVPDRLPDSLRRHYDARAEREAIRAAQTSFENLLRTPPLEATPTLAIAIGRQLAAVVLNDCGEIIDSRKLASLSEATSLAERHQVRSVVLPTQSHQHATLSEAESCLGTRFPITQVSPAGLTLACSGLPYPKPVASALVLGRRALCPFEEWTRVDPVRLGLAEFQADLDEERLRAALLQTRDLARIKGVEAPVSRITSFKLGRFAQSLKSLRPGQVMEGVVTSVTPFGAFVNLGLDTQGLIHVSELADRFVRDPAEVVRIGQTVLVKILEMDEGRGRISLSMRRENRPEPRGNRAAKRSDALSALNSLFKK